jgi:hypothetical protein
MPAIMIPSHQGYSGSPLLSTLNFDEHELIYLLPKELYGEMNAAQRVSDLSHMGATTRMGELLNWIERGHTLVVLGLSPAAYQWMSNRDGQVYNGSIESLPVLNLVKTTAKSGRNVEPLDKRVSDLLGEHAQSLGYDTVIQGANLNPLLRVRTANRRADPSDVVAGYVNLGQGLLIFAPHAQGPGQPYWKALEQLPSLLRGVKPEFPPWTDSFRTAPELSAFDGVLSRKTQIEGLTTEVGALKAEIENARQLKQLFVGTGTPFENAVADALRELGLEVVPGPHYRADLLTTNGSRIAAVEAKGIESGAKEEYVRQVMMWMPEVDAALAASNSSDPVLDQYRQNLQQLSLSHLDRNTDCKGILVLGTFRQVPLHERTQADFSENVVRVLVRQDICALSGLQLFALVVLSRSNPALKEKFRTELFSTRGVLDLAKDWQQVLAKV